MIVPAVNNSSPPIGLGILDDSHGCSTDSHQGTASYWTIKMVPFIISYIRCTVTGEGHKTRSVFRRRLSRVELDRTPQFLKTLEPRMIPKLKKQLDCPQRRRRLNLGSPRPKLRLLSTGNPTTTKSVTTIDNLTQTLMQLTSRLLVQPHNCIRMSSHISTKYETVTCHQNPGPGPHQYDGS